MKKIMILLYTLLIGLTACRKTEVFVKPDQNLITPVLADNFNLSYFSAAIQRANLSQGLREKGPFTILAPANTAFQVAGYGDINAVLTADASDMTRLTKYHVLEGYHDLDNLPLGFNHELVSQGNRMYVSKWKKDGDTVLTMNGAQVLVSIAASNGVIKVLDRVLEPSAHDRLGDAVAGENELTLFSRVLYRSGLSDLLNGTGPYTVFAPGNKAMEAYGYASLEDIDKAAPEDLATLVRSHVISGRNFISDYRLRISLAPGMVDVYLKEYDYWEKVEGMAGKEEAQTLEGSTVSVTVGEYTIDWYGSGTVFGIKDAAGTVVSPVHADINVGNGVLHIIDGVMSAR